MRALLLLAAISGGSLAAAPPVSDEPALPQEGLVPATPATPSTYVYRVTRRVVVTPEGQVDQANTESSVTVVLEEPNRIRLIWERGHEVVYQAVGADPVALKTEVGRRWVPTIRAHRVTTTGSVEQLVLTQRAFVLTVPSASSLDISVTYAPLPAVRSVAAVQP